jgi:hypothetical protein
MIEKSNKMKPMTKPRPKPRASSFGSADGREAETLDTFYDGRVIVRQRKDGYRFALDAPLLADYVRTKPGERLLACSAGAGSPD